VIESVTPGTFVGSAPERDRTKLSMERLARQGGKTFDPKD
jgi:hypothetical protein